jgi:hypothetical protein
MTRIIAKLFAVTVIFTAFLHVTPVWAVTPVAFVSNAGGGSGCTSATPCDLGDALNNVASGGEIICLDSTVFPFAETFVSASLTIDCPGVITLFNVNNSPVFTFNGTNQVVKIRNVTMNGTFGGFPAIKVTGSGTLILESCVFENMLGTALDIEPNGAFNLVITNSRISNSAAGVVIKPAAGGSVTATFNGVTIVDNTGGGMKTDTTNGQVRVDISNSTISNNSGNGLNAVSGAGGANMLNLKSDVIAGNGTAGVQANGMNAAALIDMTLLDSNANGALTTINGGRLLSYGNNHIVGSPGSGFTGTAPSQ